MESLKITEIIKKPEVTIAGLGAIIGLAIGLYGSKIAEIFTDLNTSSQTTETTGIDQEWCMELYDENSCK